MNSVYAPHKWIGWRTCESGSRSISIFVRLLLLALTVLLDLRFVAQTLLVTPCKLPLASPCLVPLSTQSPKCRVLVVFVFVFFFYYFSFASFFPGANSHQIHQEVPIQKKKKKESVFLVLFLLPFSELF